MRARTIGTSSIATTVGAAPAITGLIWALCRWEARRARNGDRPYSEALPGSALLGMGLGDRPVRIAWLGDSLATGLGCDEVADTPAHLTARMLERAVDVSVLAVPGARVGHVIEDQLPLLDRSSDLVVLCVGANDVASTSSRARFAEQVDHLLEELAPIPVVMLSLPDMSMPDRIAEPLRTLAGLRARWFDAARARVAAHHPHVTTVDVASRPAGVTRREGRTMLCADRFHPGPLGYRVWAERIATACHDLLEPAFVPGPRTTLTD